MRVALGIHSPFGETKSLLTYRRGVRSGREDRAAPRKHRRGTATASSTSTPCRMLQRARDAPRGEMCGGRGRVHHRAKGLRNSPPYCGGGTRAQLWKKKKEKKCEKIRDLWVREIENRGWWSTMWIWKWSKFSGQRWLKLAAVACFGVRNWGCVALNWCKNRFAACQYGCLNYSMIGI